MCRLNEKITKRKIYKQIPYTFKYNDNCMIGYLNI